MNIYFVIIRTGSNTATGKYGIMYYGLLIPHNKVKIVPVLN